MARLARHDEAIARFRWADMFVFSSLRDTSGNVMLEALAAGTPIICFDHQGAGEIVTPECGIKLPVTKPAEAIQLLSNALLRCHDHRQQLNELSPGAFQRASVLRLEPSRRAHGVRLSRCPRHP